MNNLFYSILLLTIVTLIPTFQSGCRATDRVALETEIKTFLSTLDTVQNSADIGRFTELLDNDIIFFPPDANNVSSRKVVSEWYSGFFNQFSISIVHELVDVHSDGSFIVITGNARGTLTPKNDGTSIPFDNKYLYVLKRYPDGTPKFWRVMFNANAKAPNGG